MRGYTIKIQMGDYFDKETKQFLLIFAGIALFLLLIYPRINDNLMTYDFTGQLSPILRSAENTGNGSPSIINLEKDADYAATVSTSLGNFKIDLFEEDAPKNVAMFIANAQLYKNATIAAQKDFLFKIDVKNEPSTRTADEINADYLQLNTLKVKDARFLRDLYDPNDPTTNAFAPQNLSKFDEFTVKEFYTEELKYSYDPELTTTKATKYVVYMASNGPDQNKIDFFVLMAGTAPHVDGRYTPIGQVIEGFDVVDKINNSGSSATVKSVVAEFTN